MPNLDCDAFVLAGRLPDPRADGGEREVRLTPGGVRILRAVRGIKMRLWIPIEAYEFVLAQAGEGWRVRLGHKDPDLSIVLDPDAPALTEVWGAWARRFSSRAPSWAPQPRRRSMTLLKRRPRIFLRRKPGRRILPPKMLAPSREIISWE